MATAPDLTDEQRANLAILAAYLRSLPANYPDFAMDDFTSDCEDFAYFPACGTAACAVGHGPAAGFEPRAGETWFDYSERLFVPDSNIDAWHWCFSGGWTYRDNTAHGAASRIEWLLAHGVPSDACKQLSGDAPLCYRADAL